MKKIFIIILVLTFTYGQNVENTPTQKSIGFSENPMELKQQDKTITSIENLTYTPIEKPIDTDTYVLGPGDLLGINIISIENISFPIRINPVGDIIIPSVGVVNVNGITLTEGRIKISDYIIKTALKNAVVNVTLLDIRRYKIQVLGAVHNPGSVFITAMDKVYDVILHTGGVQKYAHADIINIIRDGETIEVKLKEYLSGKDISQNLLLKFGDIIFVPFSDYAITNGLASSTYNNHQVIITGYVNRNSRGNSFVYYPGYTVHDYVAMAGGTKEVGTIFEMGNIKKSVIYRSSGKKIKNAIDEIVLPGDVIEIPPSLLYQIVGRNGTIGTFASVISSAYLIYAFTR